MEGREKTTRWRRGRQAVEAKGSIRERQASRRVATVAANGSADIPSVEALLVSTAKLLSQTSGQGFDRRLSSPSTGYVKLYGWIAVILLPASAFIAN